MHVTFIKPNMGVLENGRIYHDRGRMEPLTFAVLAGQLPPHVTYMLYDDRYETIPFDQPTDVVAINVEIYTARRAYEIATAYRQRGVPVVLGGCHVSMMPQEAAEYADAILIGDAEGVWPDVVRDAAAGRLQSCYQGRAGHLSGLRTRWDLFNGKRYLPIRLTQFSRGCVNACEYCATASIYHGALHHRPVEEVVDELREQRAPLLFFVDDNITANPTAAKELFRQLIPLRRRWVGQASLDFVKDRELMDLMQRSGCAGLVIGFESLDAENLHRMQKTCNQQFTHYREALTEIRRIGLLVWAALMFGYDADTEASIRRTVAWAIEEKFCFAAFNILTPYPATPLYTRLQGEGRLLYAHWWLDDAYRFGDAVFHPARMSAEELTDLCFWARRTFNHPRSVWRRMWDFHTNAQDLWHLTAYLTYNPLFRRELFKKHGMKLGYQGTLPVSVRTGTVCHV